MKRAFTLIELLVVIAIIAILAAILFPVFAQAKLAAKKTQGLSQAKQIGTGLQIYLNDADDTLPGYRWTEDLNNTPINPTYLKLKAAGSADANLIETRAQNSIFINQMLDPYIKNDDIWKAPTNPNAWVNVQKSGTADPDFRSYGGQNSYAVNNYVFKASSTKFPASQYSATSIEGPSDTVGLIDATYYNVLPAMPNNTFCKIGGYSKTGSYLAYWKQLGNGTLDFNNYGSVNPMDPSNADAIKKVESRYGGVINAVRMDTSAKALNAKAAINNLKADPKASYWNPLKTPCE